VDGGIADEDQLAKVTGERDTLRKALADRDAAIADLADRTESTLAKVGKIVSENFSYRKQISDLTKQLAEYRKPVLIVDNVTAHADKVLGGIETALADLEAKTAGMAARFSRLEGQ
jgi:chromosome segregation ATPase